MRQEDFVGLWDSGLYDRRPRQSSQLGFLPDGRGWTTWANSSGTLTVGRLHWRCTPGGQLELRYAWRIIGSWRGSTETLALTSVTEQRPDSTVLYTNYTIGLATAVAAPEPYPALRTAEPVEASTSFALARRDLGPRDDPSYPLFPYY